MPAPPQTLGVWILAQAETVAVLVLIIPTTNICMLGWYELTAFWSLYLDTQRDDISETGEWLGRVKTLESWINHPIQCIDVVQLGGCPPDKGLLRPVSRAAIDVITTVRWLQLWINVETIQWCRQAILIMITSQMAYGLSKAPAWQLQSCRHRSWGYTDRSCPPRGHYIPSPDLQPV
jgi:hypothetical protein